MFKRLIEALEQISYELDVANTLKVIEIHAKDGLEIDKAEDDFMESEVGWIYKLEAKHDKG